MDGDLGRLAAAQGGFVFRWQALEAGWSPRSVDTLLRRREWVRIRRGAYAEAALVSRLSAAGRHLLTLRAAVAHLDGDVVATGHSALAALGIPLWGVDLDVVHVHRDGAHSSRREAGVSHHRGALSEDEILTVDGLRVAVPERALLVASRSSSFEAGVVMADGALKLPIFDPSRAAAYLEGQRDWPGSDTAGQVLRFADPRAATVGESRARVLLARIGVPAPELQHEVRRTSDGRLIGIVDFYLDEFRAVIEFDGKVKYGRELYEASGEVQDVDVTEVLWAEKLREDAIRDEGNEVSRLVWSDLDGRDTTIRTRLLRSFARGSRRNRPA